MDSEDDVLVSASGTESDNDQDDSPGIIAQVLPYLYVGDASAACNSSQIKELGINYALNCSSEDVNFGDATVSLFENYSTLPIENVIDEDISKYFESAFEIILKAKQDEKKILVFSEDGFSRAPSIVIAYMMIASERQNKKLPLSQALKHLESKYEHVNINPGFQSKLVALEVELYGEASVRLTGKSEKRGGSNAGSRRGNSSGRGGRGNKGKRGK